MTLRDPLDEHRRTRQPDQLDDAPMPAEPRDRRPLVRRLKQEQYLTKDTRPVLTTDAAYNLLTARAHAHIREQQLHTLVLGAPPGLGKTTLAVRLAEWCAAQGLRVFYVGPRRNFYPDVLAIAKRPEWWYDWLARQEGSETQIETCRFVPEMTIWLNKGYEAMKFCSNGKICGWNYINEGIQDLKDGYTLSECRGCRYHAQKGITAPIIFGRHQHIALGHPLMDQFDVIIGDELPLQSFLHQWIITEPHIDPSGMAIDDPYTEIVHTLARLARDVGKAEGPDLLKLLGGAAFVQEACEAWKLRAEEAFITPNLRNAEAVESVPYFHLLSLARLLLRESIAAQTQAAYPHRVVLVNGKLHLLQRHYVNDQARNKPTIWLDATANAHLYEAMFTPTRVEVEQPHVQLAGHVRQIWNRSNNKNSFFDKEGALAVDKKGTRTKLEQTLIQVKRIIDTHGYQNPLIVTYQDLEPTFQTEGYQTCHFYGARGTNAYEQCDAAIVVGTPQPNILDIEKTARMLWFDRMEPFNAEWSEQDAPYLGTDLSYPVSGFWHDADLQAMLWQQREAELIQGGHRVRPLRREVDVWLLTNVPLDGLAPNELMTINDVFDAPGNVDPYAWPTLLTLADAHYEADQPLIASEVATVLNVTLPTARSWMTKLIEAQPDRWQMPPPDYILPKRRGKPPFTVVPA